MDQEIDFVNMRRALEESFPGINLPRAADYFIIPSLHAFADTSDPQNTDWALPTSLAYLEMPSGMREAPQLSEARIAEVLNGLSEVPMVAFWDKGNFIGGALSEDLFCVYGSLPFLEVPVFSVSILESNMLRSLRGIDICMHSRAAYIAPDKYPIARGKLSDQGNLLFYGLDPRQMYAFTPTEQVKGWGITEEMFTKEINTLDNN